MKITRIHLQSLLALAASELLNWPSCYCCRRCRRRRRWRRRRRCRRRCRHRACPAASGPCARPPPPTRPGIPPASLPQCRSDSRDGGARPGRGWCGCKLYARGLPAGGRRVSAALPAATVESCYEQNCSEPAGHSQPAHIAELLAQRGRHVAFRHRVGLGNLLKIREGKCGWHAGLGLHMAGWWAGVYAAAATPHGRVTCREPTPLPPAQPAGASETPGPNGSGPSSLLPHPHLSSHSSGLLLQRVARGPGAPAFEARCATKVHAGWCRQLSNQLCGLNTIIWRAAVRSNTRWQIFFVSRV